MPCPALFPGCAFRAQAPQWTQIEGPMHGRSGNVDLVPRGARWPLSVHFCLSPREGPAQKLEARIGPSVLAASVMLAV